MRVGGNEESAASKRKQCGIGGTVLVRSLRPRSVASEHGIYRFGLNGVGIWMMFVRINGEVHYLWRAVDHEGEGVEAFVTKRRNRKAAPRFRRKGMKRYGRPETIVTDKLGSYQTALRTIGNAALGDRLCLSPCPIRMARPKRPVFKV